MYCVTLYRLVVKDPARALFTACALAEPMSTRCCGSAGPVRPKQAKGIPASASSATRGSSGCSSESRKASTLRLAIRRRRVTLEIPGS
jgi:hypothetical protein